MDYADYYCMPGGKYTKARARPGGLARAQQIKMHDPEHQRRAGLALKASRPPDYFKQLAKKGLEVRWGKKSPPVEASVEKSEIPQ